MSERLLREWVREQLLQESAGSEAHEQSIADAFPVGATLPDTLPPWLTALGLVPGSEILSSQKVGGSGSKTDVLVETASGFLAISAKMSNADFFGNWYTHAKVQNELDPTLMIPIAEATRGFAETYSPDNDGIFVGVSISFAGRRGGRTGKTFRELFGNRSEELMRAVITGAGGDPRTNANCLYTTTVVPQTVQQVIDNLSPINESTLAAYAETFSLAFRPVYTATNNTNMGKQVWAKLEATQSFPEPKQFTSYADLMTVCRWVSVAEGKENHFDVVKDLVGNNIFVPLKSKRQKALDKYLQREGLLQSVIRESLLTEDLSKSDKKDIERMIRKQIQSSERSDRDVKKLAEKVAMDAIKDALGVSYFGTPGKINKFVLKSIHEEVNDWLGDKKTQNEIADITKAVVKKLYRELSFASPQIIDRIKV